MLSIIERPGERMLVSDSGRKVRRQGTPDPHDYGRTAHGLAFARPLRSPAQWSIQCP